MGWGDIWHATVDKAKQAGSAVTGAVTDGAGWVADKAKQGAGFVADKAKQLGEAAVATGAAIGRGAKRVGQGVAQSFTGGPKGFVCLPCIYHKFIYQRKFKQYQGKQLRVCTDAEGNQTVEEVERNPDGTYTVTGRVEGNPPTTGDVWNAPTPVTPYTVPAPSVSHVNGISNTPAVGLGSAMELQRQIHGQCPGKGGSAGGGSTGADGKGCPACDCIIYTYSEDLGVASDLVQCLAGKMGWDGKVTQEEEQMMRDAIENQRPLTMSAHSRGSILTENAWDNVFNEYSDSHLNDAGPVAAGEQAYQETLRSTGDPLSAWAAQDRAQRLAANDLAAAQVNQYVHVVSSGNAVSFYNPYEEGTRVISTSHGIPVDGVNVLAGSSRGGRMETVRHEIPPGDSIVGMHHGFDKYYAETVAAQFCNQ